MSLHTDPNDTPRDLLDALETCVAREHWGPILHLALLNGAFLIGLALLLGLSATQALALIHVVSAASGLFSGVVALRMEEMAEQDAAVVIARRSMAALLVAGTALLLAPLAP